MEFCAERSTQPRQHSSLLTYHFANSLDLLVTSIAESCGNYQLCFQFGDGTASHRKESQKVLCLTTNVSFRSITGN